MKHSQKFVVGGLLGAAIMWLFTTTKGRAAKEKMEGEAATLFLDMKKTVLASPTWKQFTRHQYVRLVKQMVKEYTKKHHLAKNVEKFLTSLLTRQWEVLKEEIEAAKKRQK